MRSLCAYRYDNNINVGIVSCGGRGSGEYSRVISMDLALENDNLIVIGRIALDATIDKLLSKDRAKNVLGIQSARYFGGPEVVQKLSDIICRSSLANDKGIFEKAVDALTYIRQKGWFEFPSFLARSESESDKSDYHTISPNISIGCMHVEGVVQIAQSNGDVVQIGTLSFNDIMREIKREVDRGEGRSLNAEERKLLLLDLEEFQNRVNIQTIEKAEAVNLLQRIKNKAPWLDKFFLAVNERAIG